jgi:phosphoglycolate phosphatase
MSMSKKVLAVFDFDNTLFDWVHVWYSCFEAMMGAVEQETGLSIDDLAKEVRAVHQHHGTSEYAFLLEALPSLRPHLAGRKSSEVFENAIIAFRTARKLELQLYPRVADTLLKIKGAGARIAIYTESQSFYSFYRLKRLGLDGVVDRIYTPPDHDLPDSFLENGGRHYSRDYYQLRYAEHRHTPRGELKPNPDLLQHIGDSRHKDIAMAKDAGVDYAWASYGEAQDTNAYEMLKLVTHWSDEDVEREKRIRSRTVDADIILDKNLYQIFDHYTFSEYHQ